ncbi:HAUS augmin-like complex subunit 7 [Echeneis naucrates]|uniref:HAUS augmin-like complex, subunit 7 n=1 Tax=Echeneis naucrates TaxID=173247 RepID=A0A665USU9_ECHNA|nr:HAUS augmin-like complex subunit 7 [Echeneis naucrates]
MAGSDTTENRLARFVYAALQAVSCPLVDGLYLQEADNMLHLLCTPSQHRTDIVAWICSRINPNFATSKGMSTRSKDPDVLIKEMAVLGQELMLCRAGDLDLIRGDTNPLRQLQFLEQLLTLIPKCSKSAGYRRDEELLLNELYAVENLPHLMQMLQPTCDPWPAHMKALCKGTKSSAKSSKNDADVGTLLEFTQSALEQAQSECEYLIDEPQSPIIFSPNSLRVAACDLQQLMATFSHVYETDLNAYCSRDSPSFSTETAVFQRVHRLLLACNTELEMLKEVSETSLFMSEGVNSLQTHPHHQGRGENHMFLNKSGRTHQVERFCHYDIPDDSNFKSSG